MTRLSIAVIASTLPVVGCSQHTQNESATAADHAGAAAASAADDTAANARTAAQVTERAAYRAADKTADAAAVAGRKANAAADAAAKQQKSTGSSSVPSTSNRGLAHGQRQGLGDLAAPSNDAGQKEASSLRVHFAPLHDRMSPLNLAEPAAPSHRFSLTFVTDQWEWDIALQFDTLTEVQLAARTALEDLVSEEKPELACVYVLDEGVRVGVWDWVERQPYWTRL